MHGTVPLLRPLTAAVAHSSSRIPHINLHIVQNRSTSLRRQGAVKICTRLGQRQQSSFVDATTWKPFTADSREELAASFPQRDSETSKIAETTDSITPDSTKTEEEPNLYTILDGGHQDQILYALLDETIGLPFLRYASDELFDKALLALDPNHFVEPHKDIYRYLRLPEDRSLRSSITRIGDRFDALTSHLDKIISVRTESGNDLTLDACRHLLRWAGSLGNETLASQIMRIVRSSDSMKSDVACYNYYLQATTWNGAFSEAERFLLRVIPRHLQLRAALKPPQGLSGHRTSNPIKGLSGVRNDTLKIFRKLIEKDLIADEFTFINLMIGMGREADMAGVKSVLKSVWNIDVDLLHTYDEDEVESPTFYEADSPLRPSERLLFAIAHVFGSNNDARTAWLLVDYVSRNYDLRISEAVWQHLLEWYLVLSLSRSPAEAKQGRKTGFLHPEVLSQLFNVMEDEPFNIKPNGVMHYLMSRSEADRHRLTEQLEAVRKLRASFVQQRIVVETLTRDLEYFMTENIRSKRPYNFWADRYFFQISDEFVKESLKFEALNGLMRHAVKQHLFIRHYARPYHPTTEQWERQVIPDLIREFAEFLPPAVEYNVSSGHVSIDCVEHRNLINDTKYGKQDKLLAKLRAAFDVHDHDNRFRRVRSLAWSLTCAKCDSSDHYTGGCPYDEPQPRVFRSEASLKP